MHKPRHSQIFKLSLFMILSGWLIGCAPQGNLSAPQQPIESLEAEQAKIIGGALATDQDEWSKMVVGIWIGGEKISYICSGTLISDQLVVTAAHCVDQAKQESLDLYVVFSKEIFSDSPDLKRKVQNSLVHPNYYSSSVKYADIALLRFEGGLPSGYRPAPLLSKSAAQSILQSGQEILLAGYGVDYYESKYVKGGEGYMRGVSVSIANTSADSDRVIVENESGKCSAPGDSGGPGFVMWNGQWHLWGVNSYGDETKILKSGCTVRSGSMRIPHFERWLKRSAQALAPDA